MFVELHILQNFVPANLNRDDTGAPKDCEFVGVRPARTSRHAVDYGFQAGVVTEYLEGVCRQRTAEAHSTGIGFSDYTV